MSPADDPDGTPFLRVVRGDPTPEEIAKKTWTVTFHPPRIAATAWAASWCAKVGSSFSTVSTDKDRSPFMNLHMLVSLTPDSSLSCV